jgi:arylsulfatase A-like enzyme
MVSNHKTAHIDIAPTMARLAGVDIPASGFYF